MFTNLVKKVDQRYAMALMLALVVAVVAGSAFASNGIYTPTLNLDFDSMLSYVFTYADMIFSALSPVVAIGVGFAFGLGLLGYVANMISKAVRGGL